MRKKIIFKLFLLTALMTLLWSCRSEDLLQQERPSGLSTESLISSRYASRSLWKEDGVYINKVQQVFLKIANLEHVRAKYGELNWDYAMSFGNFNETYVIVPIIKNGKVVFLMEAVRTGSKLFLYEKDDQELIAFFNAAIYGKIIRYDESLSGENGISSKALNYVCSTRSLSVGCDGEPGCVPYVKTETVCGFQQGGSPPKGFDPSGDPNLGSGGGGDDGYEYPEPPEEIPNKDIIDSLKSYPCAQTLVKQLPTLKNDIATAMNGIFNNNENYDIIFRAKSGLGQVDGTTYSSYSPEFGTFKATINLNDNVLTNATKEYILVTMYHEVIHAYLDYEKLRLGNEAFEEQYPSVIAGYDYATDGTMVNRFTFIAGHQQLGAFLTTLQNILSAYNPNLSLETIKAMAKAGITTMTTAEIELNKNERDTSLGKQKGTKCP